MSEPLKTYDKYLTTTTTQKAFVLLYGSPACGKTTGALTFPNPLVVDFDNNLPVGTSRVIQFWKDEFVDKIIPRTNPKFPANRRDALLIVLADLARDLPAGHTIVIDSLTRIESTYNMQEEVEPKPRSIKSGEVDGHALFRKRLIYFDTLFTMLTGCAANVVFIAHQQADRNDKGEVVQQLRPALMGQMGEKLPGYFSCVLQACRKQDMTTKNVEYLWRIRPGVFEPARVPKPVTTDFIPQDYAKLLPLL